MTAPPSGPTDAKLHKKYLDYRERHSYFGHTDKILAFAEFTPLDAEHAQLDAKGEDKRDDEEEARFVELAKLLFRD